MNEPIRTSYHSTHPPSRAYLLNLANFMKEFGHVVAGVGGPIGEKDQWPNSFIKVVLGKETTFISNFLHISCPGEKDYFYYD